MSQLSFQVNAGENSNHHEARVLVDGVDILKSIDPQMIGLDPVEFFLQKSLLDSGTLYIGRCSCGVLSCGWIDVNVNRTASSVEWSADYLGATNYEFDLHEYDRVIERASSDTAWETVDRTAIRLVKQMDFSQAKAVGLTFNNVNADPLNKEVIELWFTREPVPPDTLNVSYHVPWDWTNSDEAVKAVQAMLDKWEADGRPGKNKWQW